MIVIVITISNINDAGNDNHNKTINSNSNNKNDNDSKNYNADDNVRWHPAPSFISPPASRGLARPGISPPIQRLLWSFSLYFSMYTNLLIFVSPFVLRYFILVTFDPVLSFREHDGQLY